MDAVKSEMALMHKEYDHKMTELARIHQSKEIAAENKLTELNKRTAEADAKSRKWKVCE